MPNDKKTNDNELYQYGNGDKDIRQKCVCLRYTCVGYAYHAIHSADKWFFNPSKFTEPDFHENGMDNPDNPCNVVLSDTELLDYLHKVRYKTENYLDNLSDEGLNEKPDGCEYTRLELILGQFRHISSHIGMINGQTIERTGRFPVFSGLDGKQTEKLYDE